MADDFAYDVFLSHNATDKARVRQLAERLRTADLRVWFDEWAIQPGDDMYLAIERGLETSRTLVLCLSAAALNSDWVGLERSTVLFRDPLNRARRFVPLLLADCNLPNALQRYRYVDYRQSGDAAFDELLAACLGSRDPHHSTRTTTPLLKSKVEDALRATRRHDEANAIRLWSEVRSQAADERNEFVEIQARLETSLIALRSCGDSDAALSELDNCVRAVQAVDMGGGRPRLLQLLGEAHRLRGNLDQARGFISRALEHSRGAMQKCDEGWALLALSALAATTPVTDAPCAALDLIDQAYDCFTAHYTSGDADRQRKARHGFAECHLSRAGLHDHHQVDAAMAEYACALEILEQLGDDYEWNSADVLWRRGSLHARADDPGYATKDLFAAAERFKKLGDHIAEAECILQFAELLDRLGRRNDSRQFYQDAASIAAQQDNGRQTACFLFRYGCKLAELREFGEATSIFLALLQADWISPAQRTDVLTNLCVIADVTENESDVARYSRMALEIIDARIEAAPTADARRNLLISKSHMLRKLGEHDRAEASLRRAMDGFEVANDSRGLVACWFHLGGIARERADATLERQAYDRVLASADHKRDSLFLPIALAMLAQLDISEQRFDDARQHLDRADRLNEAQNNPMVSIISLDLRSKLPSP